MRRITGRDLGWFLALAAAGCVSVAARAEVRFANVFNDHMVLQREKPLNVWGFASPGERLAVSFAGQERRATADASGEWCVTFSPLEASKVGRELKVVGPFNTVTYTDVLVGDVWLAGGQSNMEYDLSPMLNCRDEFLAKFNAAVADGRIRGTKANYALSCISTVPMNDLHERAVWGMFASAVSQVFSLALSDGLDGDVPIGMYVGAERGNRIEPYVSKAAWEMSPWTGKGWYLGVAREIETNPDYRNTDASKAALFGSSGEPNSNTPACKWNVLYEPVRRMAVKGAIWYQGESNGGEAIGDYQAKLEALVDGWRTAFGTDLAFGIFSLNGQYFAPGTRYQGAVGYYTIDCAQVRVANRRKLVGIGSIWDTGNDAGGLHPIDKISAGQRVANWALRHVYGQAVDDGPWYKSHTFSGNTATVSFHDAEKGLISAARDSTNYYVPEKLATPITGFGLRDAASGKWDWASACVVNADKTITVTLASAAAVDAVAYFGYCGELGSCYSGAAAPQPLACFSTEASTYPAETPERLPVASPFGLAMMTTVAWTGKDQKPAFPTSGDYAISADAGEWKDVGSYSAAATLKGATCWTDGTTAPKTLTFRIVSAPNRWVVAPAMSKTTWKENAAPASVVEYGTPSFGDTAVLTVKDADGKAAPATVPTTKGHWFLTFTVPATGNYAGVEQTIELSIIGADERVSGVADETAVSYSWAAPGGGAWEAPADWSVPGTEPYFGYPNDPPVSATFKSLAAPVTVTATGVRQINALTVNASDVTLSGGTVSNAALTIAGTTPRLALANGATVQSTKGVANIPAGSAFCLTDGSTLDASLSARAVTGFTFAATNSAYRGAMSVYSVPSAHVTFKDSDITGIFGLEKSPGATASFEGSGGFTVPRNQGLGVSGAGTRVSIASGIRTELFSAVAYGGAKIVFGGADTTIRAGIFCYNAAVSDGTIEFAPGARATIGNYIGFRNPQNVAHEQKNSRIVVNDASVSVNSCWFDAGEGSRLEFRGAAPNLTVVLSRQAVKFGSADPTANNIPSLSYVLPFQPYEAAPLQLNVRYHAGNATRTTDQFYPNVPIVLDLTGFAGGGTVPLIESSTGFATAIAGTEGRTAAGFLATLSSRLTATCDGKDVTKRAKLALSSDGKTLSAEILPACDER